MAYLLLKAAISGILIALVSEISRKLPGIGALVASLPLVSVLGMIWLWRDTGDPALLADHAAATLWFILPSVPMFVLIPLLLRAGFGFYPSLGLGCGVTILLYLGMVWLAPRFGLTL
jgi:hypothetical protein